MGNNIKIDLTPEISLWSINLNFKSMLNLNFMKKINKKDCYKLNYGKKLKLKYKNF